MKLEFGQVVYLKRKLFDRLGFQHIPVGTKAVVVDTKPVGVYCGTVVFEGFSQEIIDINGNPQEHRTGYIRADDISLKNTEVIL